MPTVLYKDDITGDVYVSYDGKSLTKVRSGNKGNDQNKGPKIGDKGNKDIQGQEEKERQENDISKEINNYNDDDRLGKLKRMKDSGDIAAKLDDENSTVIDKERQAKAAKDVARYNNSPLRKFEISLDKFVKDQVASKRERSWGRFDKRYAGTDIVRPGKRRVESKNVPLVNVYFDQSSSWSDDDVKLGEQAIATLNKYSRKKQIQLRLYYFSNSVCSTAAAARAQGGTYGQPILNHIQATYPSNVIVMTDSDISDCTSSVTVPGAVWFLWLDGTSQNLKEHLRGAQQTESFMITRKGSGY